MDGMILLIIIFLMLVMLYRNRPLKKDDSDRSDMEILMIGTVYCRRCYHEWDALAYKGTLHKLECPECGVQNSGPVTPMKAKYIKRR